MIRRTFLSAALVGIPAKGGRNITGSFVLDAYPLGHRLRDRAAFPSPLRVERRPLVIVGGGMAGLSAAWRLRKRGFRDFVVLEMEPQAGGNSRWGENEVSRYPWAAHYVPVPNRESTLVRELFADLGLVDAAGEFAERHLCHSPQERLHIHGRWQEGLEPEVAATRQDHEQYRRFNDLIVEHRATKQFTIPMAVGAKPSPLDRLTMNQWLDQHRLTSPYLRWYVDYSCRDDFGSAAADTSAWAGIHYFAAREHDEKGPLTWPEGNGWILTRLLAQLRDHVRTNAPALSLRRDGTRFRVRTPEVEYLADAVIFAAPEFLLSYLMEGAPRSPLTYSPWITANLTLDRLPREPSLDTAWDNVIYNSPALGYVVATHMSVRTRIDRTVWTYYWALAQGSPAANRQLLLDKDWGYWKERILHDLSRAHPDIRECVSRIDILRLGHAMARPTPGFLNRVLAPADSGRLLLANSDQSGFSIFEEAQFRGVTAADRALRALGRS